MLRACDDLGAVGTSYYPATLDLKWLLDEPCAALWEAYQETGLVCNLQLQPANYSVLLTLARRYPQVRFVINHLGLPGSLDLDDASYGGLMEAASCANIFVKASAFYAAAETPWNLACPQALTFFDRLVKGLGAERVLWGSDWPVCCTSSGLTQWIDITRELVKDQNPANQHRLYHQNAERIYLKKA